MKELVHCIQILGFSTGWKYWRLSVAAKKDPTLLIRWIQNCYDESKKQKATDPIFSKALSDWAKEMSFHAGISK